MSGKFLSAGIILATSYHKVQGNLVGQGLGVIYVNVVSGLRLSFQIVGGEGGGRFLCPGAG